MGCCESLFGFSELAETELTSSKSNGGRVMRLCSGLDAKCHGKQIAVRGRGEFLNVATGRGIALGETAMEQDRVYFEVVFEYFPRKSKKKAQSSEEEEGEKKQASDAVASKRRAENALATVDEVGPIDASAAKDGTIPAQPIKLFAIGVAVKTSIKKREQLSAGQSLDEVAEDHKDRWLWTWGPDLPCLDGQKKGRHVLGCAFDQSTGSGNIVVTLDGKFVAGPLPKGLRGIKGTCFPAIELAPAAAYAVRATANFSVDETAFSFPMPDGFSGLVPARGVL